MDKAREAVELWFFNNVKRPVFGHMLSYIGWCGWCGFGYETHEIEHRNSFMMLFKLRLGLAVVEGWIPD